MARPLIATIDFEASSLAEESEPIEVGIALWARGGPIRTWSSLIHMPADIFWSEESAALHGIKRSDLLRAPLPANVAEQLNAHMASSPFAFCDGGVSDERWVRRLYRGASFRPVFRLAPIEAMPGLHVDESARRMWQFIEIEKAPHRAGKDAVRLMQAYAYSLGESPFVIDLE